MTDTDETPSPVGLARLLIAYREQTGESYAALAARTGFTRGYFGYLINTPPPFYVRPDTLRRISEGLGIPLTLVRDAASETCGYAFEPSELPDRVALLAESIRRLDEVQLVGIESLVAAIIASKP